MRTSASLVLACSLALGACGSDPPPPAQHAHHKAAAGDLAPFPFTAEQIRDATKPGRSYTFKVEMPGKPTALRTVHFTKADASGFTTDVSVKEEGAKDASKAAGESGSWADLQQHAAFPRDRTKVSEGEVTVPEGKHACTIYVVTSSNGGTDTYYFAKNRPGAPVLFFKEEHGKRVMTSTLVSYQDGR